MSDTLQHVSWHLRHACPFRQGTAVDDFSKAFDATAELRFIDDVGAGDVFGDIVVTGVSYSSEGRWPSSGFRISDAVAPVGDLAAARRTCGQCPANAFPAGRMAGCCEFLSVDPGDPEMEAALRAAIHGGLADEFAAAFPRTDPLWYGLWISDPLSPAQLRLLPRLLPASITAGGTGLRQFRRACELAAEHGIEMRVHMPPPGHVDFGFETTFPHCPRCKRATGETWYGESNQMTTCKTCGQQFIPAATASSEECNFELSDLKERLSAEEYAAVSKAWQERHASEPDPMGQPFMW